MKKLTLRDLFWLVLVVAMGLGWLADRNQLDRRNKDLLELMEPFREQHLKDMQRMIHHWPSTRPAQG
jgi:hypothetical protein